MRCNLPVQPGAARTEIISTLQNQPLSLGNVLSSLSAPTLPVRTVSEPADLSGRRRSRVVAPFSPPAALSLFGRLCTGARSTLACAREGSKADSLRSSHGVTARRPNPLVRLDCSAGRGPILTTHEASAPLSARRKCGSGSCACMSIGTRRDAYHRPHQANGPPSLPALRDLFLSPLSLLRNNPPGPSNAAPTRQNRRHAPSSPQDSPRHLRPRHPLCAHRVRLDASLLYALLPSERSS